MNETHIFVELLKLGESRGVRGFDSNEFKKWALSQVEIESENSQSYQNIYRTFKESFDEIDKGYGNPNVFILKNEYYFRLVEFEELRLSREASTSAKKYSIFAMSIYVLAILISITASYIQTNSPISIEQNQIGAVKLQLESAQNAQQKQQSELKAELKNQSYMQEKVIVELKSLNKVINERLRLDAQKTARPL
jgi:hypothetical protein